ncbi:VOC family protein [Solitalea sp. MAHUQ-68]|uniref:VOC family protein n=1 Tax=Solitalea agri TaxID=2953739 RepID=A0A9X2F194_9SPHI|nr:VOC family protein [Solitalea agri]MCO4292249.1 VOC family protein [Solitalea agri]
MKHKITGMTPMLMVYDMQTSLAFYCNVLGFNLIESAGPQDDIGWVLLRLNDIELMLNTQYEKPDRPHNQELLRNDHHGDVCLYFACNDIDGLYQSLKSKNIALKEPYITGYGWQTLDLTDPDGFKLSFHKPLHTF